MLVIYERMSRRSRSNNYLIHFTIILMSSLICCTFFYKSPFPLKEAHEIGKWTQTEQRHSHDSKPLTKRSICFSVCSQRHESRSFLFVYFSWHDWLCVLNLNQILWGTRTRLCGLTFELGMARKGMQFPICVIFGSHSESLTKFRRRLLANLCYL